MKKTTPPPRQQDQISTKLQKPNFPHPHLKNNKKETQPKLLQREQIDLNKPDRLNSNLAKRNQPSRDYFFIVVVEQPILNQRSLQFHQLLLQLYISPMNMRH